MSAEIDTRLRCDAPECDAVIEFVGGTAGRSLARTFAREYGWAFNSRGDFCPEHSERLSPWEAVHLAEHGEDR